MLATRMKIRRVAMQSSGPLCICGMHLPVRMHCVETYQLSCRQFLLFFRAQM